MPWLNFGCLAVCLRAESCFSLRSARPFRLRQSLASRLAPLGPPVCDRSLALRFAQRQTLEVDT